MNDKNIIKKYLPTRAPSATRLPIHDSSSAVGIVLKGESDKSLSDGLIFGNAGDVQPSVVPKATELKLAM